MNLESVEDDIRLTTQEVCVTCGTSDFYAEAGHYYCSLCNTQSQSARVYVDESFIPERQHQARAAVIRKEGEISKRKSRAKPKLYTPSSWEIYNVVLKYFADRLVEIGFPEVIKDKVLHLYSAFMIRRKAIFVSKVNPEAKSAITFGEPIQNLLSLYNDKDYVRRRGKQKRKLDTVDKSKDAVDAVTDKDDLMSMAQKKRKVALTKRKALEKDYKITESAKLAEEDAEFERAINAPSSVMSNNDKQQQHKSYRIRLTKAAKAMKSKYFKGLNIRKAIYKSGILRSKAIRTPRYRRYDAIRGYLLNYERFTLQTCYTLLFVALRQLGFPVVFSDLMSLKHHGILEIENQNELLKLMAKYEQYKDVNIHTVFFCTHHNYRIENYSPSIDQFVRFMGIKKFFSPTMKEIVPKYIDDFVLPREFECLVNLLNHSYTKEEIARCLTPLAPESYHYTPEFIVISQIVALLKMLFGLDDVTERYLSEFARLMNRVIREEAKSHRCPMEEWTELFVIEDWFGYLRRRRDLVKRQLYSHSSFTPNRPPTATQVKDMITESCSNTNNGEAETLTTHEQDALSCIDMLKSLFTDRMSPELADLPSNTRQVKPFIPLPLPNQSVVEQYLERYPNVGDPSFKPELFKADFVQKRIDFLWKPEKYAKLLELCGYNVQIIPGNAANNLAQHLSNGTVVMFQPYKSFDEVVDGFHKTCSSSMKLLLSVCEDIVPRVSREDPHILYSKASCDDAEAFFPKLIQGVGKFYVDRVRRGRVKILTRWDDD